MKLEFYLLLLVIFLLSFWFFTVIPGETILKYVAATPALCALCAAIYQIVRDHSAHLKTLEIQQKQQAFSIGISSHMANTTFDKHIEFCEKYIAEINKTISTLGQNGPTELALNHGRSLLDVRIEYSTWVTNDMSKKLIVFEEALYKIGAKSKLSEKTNNSKKAIKAGEEAEKLWVELLGAFIDNEKIEDKAIAILSVIDYVRDILGVNELIKLRASSIEKAISNINNT